MQGAVPGAGEWEAIFDSPVIVEYMDYRSCGKLFPREPEARVRTLRSQALAGGLMDASIAMMIEGRFRPAEHVSSQWVALQRGKAERALTAFVKRPPAADSDFLGEDFRIAPPFAVRAE